MMVVMVTTNHKHCRGSARCHLSSTAGLKWLRSSHTRGLLQGIASDFVLTQLLIISTCSDFGAWCKRKRKGAARNVSEQGARDSSIHSLVIFCIWEVSTVGLYFQSPFNPGWGYIFQSPFDIKGPLLVL